MRVKHNCRDLQHTDSESWAVAEINYVNSISYLEFNASLPVYNLFVAYTCNFIQFRVDL